MSLTVAAFKVNKLLEHLIPTVLCADLKKLQVKRNPKFSSYCSGRFCKIQTFGLLLLYVHYAGRLIFLLKFFDGKISLLELGFCLATIASLSFALVLWYTEIFRCVDLCTLSNQTELVKLQIRRHPGTLRGTTKEGMFVYIFSISTGACGIVILFCPIIIPFEMVQTLLGRSWPTILLGIILNTSNVSYFCIRFMDYIVMILPYLQTVYLQSVACSRSNSFPSFLRHYRSAIILNTLQNCTREIFSTVLAAVGAPLASMMFFGTIRYVNYIDPTAYWIMPTLTATGFTIALVVTYMAGIPYEHFLKGKRSWLAESRSGYRRKLLRSLIPTGMRLGPYGMIETSLGIRICDDIINNTVNLLCLYKAD